MKRFPFKPFFVLLVTSLLLIGAMIPLTAFAKSPSLQGKSPKFSIANKQFISAITLLPNQQRLVGNGVISQQKVVNSGINVPNGYPTDCLVILGDATNITRTSTSLSYDFTASVKNTCTEILLKGGGWEANFQLDCAGTLIDDQPDLSGGLLQINVGGRQTIIDDHFVSFCLDEWGDQFAPDEVKIYISASGNLQGGGIAVGSDYFTVK